jgi:hypothetical protein
MNSSTPSPEEIAEEVVNTLRRKYLNFGGQIELIASAITAAEIRGAERENRECAEIVRQAATYGLPYDQALICIARRNDPGQAEASTPIDGAES